MSKPTILLQLTKTQDQTFWVNYAPGVWFIRLHDIVYTDYQPDFTADLVAENYQIITTVVFDNLFLNPVSSLANCLLTFASFYVDIDNCYIHAPFNQSPYNHDTKLGKGRQYVKGNERYFNDFEAEERLISVPNIQREIGDILESKLIYSGGNVELINADGELDNLLEHGEVIGNKAIIYKVINSVYTKMFSGFVTGGNPGINKVTLYLKNDIEALLNIDIPRNFFSIIDYPNMSTKYNGKPIPLLFGNVNNLEVICVEDNKSPATTYKFVVADIAYAQIHDITAVYVDGVSKTFTKSLATNSFTLLAAYYDPGQTVTADIQGFDDSLGNMITNAASIIKSLFNKFLYFIDSTDFYRIWDDANAYNIYLAVTEIKTLRDVIEEVCRSSFLSLIYEDNGTFSAIVNKKIETYLDEIQFWDVISIQNPEFDISKILTSVNIMYNKDFKNNKFYERYNDDQKETLRTLYGRYNNKNIEMNLSTESNAYAASTEIINYFNTPWRVPVLKVKLEIAEELFLGFNYIITLRRQKAVDMLGFIAKLIKIEKNLNEFTANLSFLLLYDSIPSVEIGAALYDDCVYDDVGYNGIDYEEVVT